MCFSGQFICNSQNGWKPFLVKKELGGCAHTRFTLGNTNSLFQQVSSRRSVGNSWQKVSAWIQNFITLSYLLGITWLIGFTVKFNIVMEYVFVFLNASIGVMVLLYKVVFNRKIREASQRAISRQTITSKFSMWKTDSSSGYSSGNVSSLGHHNKS